LVGLFAFLFLLTGVKFISSGDVVCNGLTCEAFVTVNTSTKICFEHSNNTNYLYKKPYSTTIWVNLNKISNIVSTDPNITVDWYVKKAKTGTLSKNWTPIYDGYCWSGKNNENKLVGHTTKPGYYKWSFVVGKVNIDPLWTSWDYLYPNKTIMDKEALMNWTTCYKWTYKNVTIEVPCNTKNETCFKCKVQNATSTDCKNYTYQVQDKYVSYDCWQEVIIEVEKTVPDTSKPKIGISVGNQTVMKQYINVWNNSILVESSVNWGDRNFVEYGRCRSYEVVRKVCSEQNLNSPNLSVSK
jgi:hypothetical protein